MLLARHPQAFPFPVARSPRLSQPSPHLTCSSLRSIDPATSTVWICLPRPLRSSASFPEGRGRSAIKQRARYPSTVGTPHVLAGGCPLPAAACCLLLAKKPFTYPPFPLPSPKGPQGILSRPRRDGDWGTSGTHADGHCDCANGRFCNWHDGSWSEGGATVHVRPRRPSIQHRPGQRRRVHYRQHPRVCCNSEKL